MTRPNPSLLSRLALAVSVLFQPALAARLRDLRDGVAEPAPAPQPAPAPRFSRTPPTTPTPPAPDSDGGEALTEWEFSSAEIAGLRAAGAL